jgi:hypothetical protein
MPGDTPSTIRNQAAGDRSQRQAEMAISESQKAVGVSPRRVDHR